MSRATQYRLTCWRRYAPNKRPSLDAFSEFRNFAPLAPSTIEAVIATVGKIHGIRDRGERLRIPEPMPDVPTIETVDAMYRHCRAATWPNQKGGSDHRPKAKWLGSASRVQWLRAFIVTACWTGLRLEDLRQLRWESIDNGVSARKTGKASPIVASPSLLRHLKPLRQMGGDRVFHRVPKKQLRRSLAEICELAGVPYTTPQGFRRFAVNQWMIANGSAGAIIQGRSLGGALDYYASRRLIVEKTAESVVMPPAFASRAERDEHNRARRLILAALRNATPSDREFLIQSALRVG